jgi:hypothetical protein
VGEQEFVDYLADNGWDVEWISILEEDAGGAAPNQSDAASWASTHDLDPASVWFDAGQDWYGAVITGFPTIYTVHTTNMLIWDRVDGWVDPDGSDWTGFLEWWPDFLDYCDAQAGS